MSDLVERLRHSSLLLQKQYFFPTETAVAELNEAADRITELEAEVGRKDTVIQAHLNARVSDAERAAQATARAERLAEALREIWHLYKTHDAKAIDVMADLARQALSDAPVGGWRPIEEAPKDGREILAWSRFDSNPVTVRWRDGKWVSSWEGSEVIESQTDFGTTYKEPSPLSHFWVVPTPPAEDI